MKNELGEFYQNWSNKEQWLVNYESEAACRKIDAILQGLPEIRDLDIKTAIDFGCGYGKALQDFFLKLKLEKAYGFDVSENGIKYAQQNFASSGLQFHQLATLDNTENAQFIKSKVDTGVDSILLIDLLEHVPDCIDLMLKLSAMTKYFIVLLPIEENLINNYLLRKVYPSTKHYNGHVREFNVNSVHYFIRKIGLTPIAEGVHIYDFRDSYPPQPSAKISLRGIAKKILKYLQIILAKVLPKRIYLGLVGPGAYFCIATFNKEHILNP